MEIGQGARANQRETNLKDIVHYREYPFWIHDNLGSDPIKRKYYS